MTEGTPYDGDVAALRRTAGLGRLDAIVDLAVVLRERFHHAGDEGDLVEAHGQLVNAADQLPRDHPALAVVLNALAPVLRDRYQLTGDPGFLRGALSCSPPPGPADPPQIAMNRSETLRLIAERDHDLAPLLEAETLQRAVLARTAPGDPMAADVRESLGELLRLRYAVTRDLTALDEGAELLRLSLSRTPADHARHADRVAALGNVLQLIALHTGDEEVREAAIRQLRRALELTPVGVPNRPYRMTDLATALTDRGRHTDDLAALREGTALVHAALEATPPEHSTWGNRAQSFLDATLSLAERTGETAVLDEAIATGDRARSRGARPITVDLLLAALRRRRFLCTGRIADLHAASAALDTAAERAPYGDPDHFAVLSNQGQIQLSLYEATDAPDHLTRAVSALGAAVRATAPDDPQRADCLVAYGDALGLRFDASGDPAVLRAAAAAYREAASTPGLRPMTRVLAARAWGHAEADARCWAEACEGFSTAVRLLPLAVSRRLDRGDQEHGLARLDGLAADAAACALRAGRPEEALQLLELARGVLLSQATQGRDDLTRLADQHPALASEIATLLDRLRPGAPPAVDQPEGGPSDGGRDGQPVTSHAVGERHRGPFSGPAADERHALDLRLRALLGEARALPGFADLLGPPTPADLYACVADGPVVLINAGAYGSDALIVRPSGVEVVPLPGLTPREAGERSAALAVAVDRAGTPGPDERAAQEAVAGVLRWLAETVVDPVLAGLTEQGGVGNDGGPQRIGAAGRDVEPAPGAGSGTDGWSLDPGPGGDGARMRVWWSPVGVLALLPVHAAAGGRVVSSYTPTLRALRRARARAISAGPTLVVAMAETPGAPPLPQAGREAQAVAALTGATVLSGAEATAAAVRAALTVHPGVHFACHAVAEPADPSAGRLLLHDHRERAMTVREIADLDLPEARLAVLSACDTSRTTPHLPDEALHLASAFQLAGYPEVVGALWPVNDRVARTVAEELHRGLSEGSGAAAALHAAVERLRAAYPGTPTLWAAFVHSGR